MEHGSIDDAKTKKGIRDLDRVLPRSIKTSTDDAGGGKELDANDQTKMDELCRTCDAREQWANDDCGNIVAKYGREKKAERRRETSSKRQRKDKMVGLRAGKIERGTGDTRRYNKRGEQQEHLEGARGKVRDTGTATTTDSEPGSKKVRNLNEYPAKVICNNRSRDTGQEDDMNKK